MRVFFQVNATGVTCRSRGRSGDVLKWSAPFMTVLLARACRRHRGDPAVFPPAHGCLAHQHAEEGQAVTGGQRIGVVGLLGVQMELAGGVLVIEQSTGPKPGR